MATSKKGMSCLTMRLSSFRLSVRRMWSTDVGAFLPLDPQPVKAIDYVSLGLGRRSFRIGVLDTEYQVATLSPAVQVIEQESAHVSEMQESTRRRRHAQALTALLHAITPS